MDHWLNVMQVAMKNACLLFFNKKMQNKNTGKIMYELRTLIEILFATRGITFGSEGNPDPARKEPRIIVEPQG